MSTRFQQKSGFTLIEILVAVGVVAVLATAAVLILDPSELLAQSRDSKRISEATTLSKTVDLYSSLSEGSSLGSAHVSYVSVPDPAALTSEGSACESLGLPQLPIGWTYHCAGPDFYENIDGTGWLPLDLSSLPSGVPFSRVPVDPRNSTSTGRYYTYLTNGSRGYMLTAAVESRKYGNGGSNDVVSKDGGQYDDLLEVGLSLALAPVDHSDAGEEGEVESVYSFSEGFLSPIESGGAGIYKLGRTLPIKFRLTGPGGGYTTEPTAHLFVTKVQDGIVGTTPVALSSSNNDNGGLFNAATNQYSYNLDTGELAAGTWQIKAVLNDGSDYAEIISLEP